jgi:hypothetical protein
VPGPPPGPCEANAALAQHNPVIIEVTATALREIPRRTANPVMAFLPCEHAAEDTTPVYAGLPLSENVGEPKRAIRIHVCGAVIQTQFTSSASHSYCVATAPLA